MAPNNQTNEVRSTLSAGRTLAHPLPGEEICITGLSGMFPDSDNIYQFRDNLFNKYDMVTDDSRRWTLVHPEIPKRTGKLNNIHKFDAAFFGIHYKQAHSMDPMGRVLLEKTYEAIIDAGVNPIELRGTSTGIFIGACFSESEKTWFYEKLQPYGFGITGCSRAILANRLSYWLGVHGPSYTVDSACSSSLYALEHAYKAIRDGRCDQAIVGGANLCLHPYLSLQFSRLGVLSSQGMCKSFDAEANGYARSEAIGVVFLQKTKDSKRIYATVVHAKTNCDGYKEQGITYPSGKMQQQLLDEFYEECQIDPTKMGWVEAHGTGTRVGDPEELNALDRVFCKGRSTPLPIGSVKSNIGHSEPASGICSVTKVLIAMETGMIPPNLHYTSPREGVPALKDGTLQVVTEQQAWDGGLVGINSFGFGGANAHVLLRWNSKSKINGGSPSDNIPRLVTISGRTEKAVSQILDDLESRPVDAELVRLYHDINSIRTPGHNYRGYTILSPGKAIRDVTYFSAAQRPLWFVFSGLTSKWTGMGKSLMTLPAFSATIAKCQLAIQHSGLNLEKIITTEKFENVVQNFVGITAILIGLVDVLESIGIRPEGLIGNSIGELAAAYADNCLSIEETILVAYYQGIALTEAKFPAGAMAEVVLDSTALKSILPKDIEIVCQNSSNSCLISGPSKSVSTLVNSLRQNGFYANELKCNQVPLHSQYISSVGPKLVSYLKKVIPTPRLRSERWISTSVTEREWKSQLGKLASAEYFSTNLLSPVLFEEAKKYIPSNAVLVEVSLGSDLLKQLNNFQGKIVNIVLMSKPQDAVDSLLTAIGSMYMAGVESQLANLYPKVSFPVSRGTPMISPYIGWEHSHDWHVTCFKDNESFKSGEREVNISLNYDEMDYYKGHVIDGRNLFPATGYLALVWETLAMMNDLAQHEIAVVFENVRFQRATNIPKEGSISFIVMVQKGSGNFEVVEGGAAIVTGKISISDTKRDQLYEFDPPTIEESADLIELTSRDIYKELRLRGYNYSGLFRSIISTDNNSVSGKIRWHNNWVAFMDNMLQMQILSKDTRGLFVPTALDKLTIDPFKHIAMVKKLEEEKGYEVIPTDSEEIINTVPAVDLDVYVYKEVGIIRSGGIEIKGLNASAITRRKPLGDPVLEKYQFVPNVSSVPAINEEDVLRICVHVGLENYGGIKVKTVELIDGQTDPKMKVLTSIVAGILGDLPLIQADMTVLTEPNNPLAADLGPNIVVENKSLSDNQNSLFVLGTGLLNQDNVLDNVISCIGTAGFMISREKPEQPTDIHNSLVLLNEYVIGDEKIVLMKKATSIVNPLVITVKEADYSWLPELQEALKKVPAVHILMVAQNEPFNGIIGLFNCIRKEPGGELVRCYFILDPVAPVFDPESPFYRDQVQKDVALNVFKDGHWGGYRHMMLEENFLIDVKHAYTFPTVKGDLSSFRWVEGPLLPDSFVSTDADELVQIYVSALNFRDVMTATGKLATEVISRGRRYEDCVQGLEFAGRDSSGKRVMGQITAGALSTLIVADKDLLWDVPDDWTLEDAATVPIVYGTAYYALTLNGRMAKGDTVLIHAGSGGVGQAAITIALYAGCTVFTTVGTQEKRDFIKERFPQLTDRHIGNSRDTSFEQLVMTETNGRGVDLVLNSLAEEKLLASVRCLAVGGRFLEIGKFDLANNNPLGMDMFLKETSFHGIMLDNLFSSSREWKRPIHAIMAKGILDGAVKPLSRTVFKDDEVEQAFRFMAAGKHIGKVLIRIRPEEKELNILPEPFIMKAFPRYICDPNLTYIIAGGLGGFGLELADWLVLRGAQKLVLTSRTGLRTGYQSFRVKIWRSYGVTVEISTEDIATEQGVTRLLTEANKLGPVAAIFNLAVVLLDALLENQTTESFVNSSGPKATATKHMDKISRKLCPQLKQFVAFSSVSCGRGNPGQCNYGMSNSVMERICEKRVEDGFPALAVQWGAVGEVGLVAEMQEEEHELVIGGTLQQRIVSCLQVLDKFLGQRNPIVASMVVAEKRAGGSGAGNIVDCVVNILGLRDLKTVSLHSTLAELGMDSMMAVEIKQTLEREFEVFLSPQDIRGLTFAKLADLANADSSESNTNTAEASDDGLRFMIRAIGNEDEAAKVLKELPSLYGENEVSKNQPIMFVIPGIEGMASVLEPLAKNLKSQVIGLQLGIMHMTAESTNSIEQMAQHLYPEVKSRLKPNEPYNLLGYSFGGVVAIELAYLLEKEGHLGKIFLVDGAPQFLQEICKTQIINDSEDQLQINLLSRIYNIIKPTEGVVEQMRLDMAKLATWNERVELFLSLVPESDHSLEYRKFLANASLQRIQALIKFNWKNTIQLKSKLSLFRPNVIGMQTSLDQGVSKFCHTPADVHFIEGDHVSILESTKMAQLINNEAAKFYEDYLADTNQSLSKETSEVETTLKFLRNSKRL